MPIKWNTKYNYLDPVRVDGPDGRVYSAKGEKLPSVTTILSKTRSPEKEDGGRKLAKMRQIRLETMLQLEEPLCTESWKDISKGKVIWILLTLDKRQVSWLKT